MVPGVGSVEMMTGMGGYVSFTRLRVPANVAWWSCADMEFGEMCHFYGLLKQGLQALAEVKARAAGVELPASGLKLV